MLDLHTCIKNIRLRYTTPTAIHQQIKYFLFKNESPFEYEIYVIFTFCKRENCEQQQGIRAEKEAYDIHQRSWLNLN